jgi:ribosome recycling factor
MSYEYSEEVQFEFEIINEKAEKTVSVLKSEFASIRAGRANPHVLDKVLADYYGVKTPINQMANISVSDARCLVIAVWDASALKAVEKAILEANIGITPVNDGKVIRLVFPELTEERRRDLVKQIKKMSEDSKVAIRNIRREALETFKKMKNNKQISEDDCSVYEKEVEKIIAKSMESIDNLLKEKEKDVMTV